MKSFKLAPALLLVILMVFSSFGSAASLDRSILPSDTHWVIHLNMSEFNKTWLKKHLDKQEDFLKLHKAEGQLFRYAKINLFEDVSGVTVMGNKRNKHDLVVVATGNFDKNHLLKQLGDERDYGTNRYKKFTIHHWHGSNYGVFAARERVIYSRNEQSLKEVLDLMSGKRGGAGSKLNHYLSMIPDNAFFSAAVEDLSGMRGRRKFPSVMLENAGLASFIALERNKDLTLDVLLNAATAETATQIQQMVTGILAVLKMQDHEKLKGTQKLLNAVEIKTKGTQVRLHFTYPSEELVHILSQRKGRSMHFDFD